MKKCPYCAETDLQDDAKVCKHCGKDISEAEKPFYNKKFYICEPTLGIIALIAGIFYWPLWILAAVFFIIWGVRRK